MADDVVDVLRETLSNHRLMVLAAAKNNTELDLDSALQVHAGLGNILADWTDFSAGEQRKIISTIEYLVNPTDDGHPDLTTSDGFHDDLAELRRLHAFLGYV
jgi:uncharacterized membrane protein YkvA (DUF1232 family)